MLQAAHNLARLLAFAAVIISAVLPSWAMVVCDAGEDHQAIEFAHLAQECDSETSSLLASNRSEAISFGSNCSDTSLALVIEVTFRHGQYSATSTLLATGPLLFILTDSDYSTFHQRFEENADQRLKRVAFRVELSGVILLV